MGLSRHSVRAAISAMLPIAFAPLAGCESSFRSVSPSQTALARRFAEELPKIYVPVPSVSPGTVAAASPSPSASATPSSGPSTAEFMLYAANGNQNTVTAFRVNKATGATALVGSYPTSMGVDNGQSPYVLAVDPAGKFVYAVNIGSSDITSFKVTPGTGALVMVGPPVSVRGTGVSHVAISPNGKNVYVTMTDDAAPVGEVVTFLVDGASGALSYVGKVNTGNYPHSVVVEPSGKYAYVVNYLGNSLSAFAIDTNSGALSPIAAMVGGAAGSVTGVNPGALGEPYNTDAGTEPRIVTPHPNGRFIYVIYEDRDAIGCWRINANGSLSPVGEVEFGAGGGMIAAGLQFDPSGNNLYGTSRSNGKVYQYSVNGKTGELTAVNGYAAGGAWTMSVAFDPAGAYAYAANGQANTITTYKVGSGGALSMPTDISAGPGIAAGASIQSPNFVAAAPKP